MWSPTVNDAMSDGKRDAMTGAVEVGVDAGAHTDPERDMGWTASVAPEAGKPREPRRSGSGADTGQTAARQDRRTGMRLRMRMDVELLDESQLEQVFQQALAVWRDVRFRVQGTDEFFSYLADYGCDICGEDVRFPQPVIDKVLARVREHKRAWMEAHGDEPPPWPRGELRMFTHGQALHICDAETNELRPCTEADLVSWCHLVDRLGVEQRSHPTFIPQDVPRGSADLHAYATIMLNSRRPHRVSVYSAKMLPFFIEASRIAQGSLDAVKRDPVFAAKCWVTSPFKITRENVEIAMDARRLLGTPIVFGIMPVAGASTPITVAGALVQNTAESLALCAMRLAIDGVPRGVTATAAIMDMRDAVHRQSGPDLLLHVVAGQQMNAYLFGGRPGMPVSYTGVSAQVVSPQSVYEKGQAAALSIAAGGRSLGIGCLAVSDVGSPVQLLLDHEMGLAFGRLLREVAIDDEHMGLDTIIETASRGAYFLETDHTARFFREECWLPAFMDHRAPLAWARDPADMVERARARTLAMMREPENQCPLSEPDRKAIRQLVAEADVLVAAE